VIVLDASVLIAFLDGNDTHHERAMDLLAREIEDEFAVNSLTLAEVLVVPARAGRLESAGVALSDLEILELPFPTDAAVRLAQLRASTNLKLPDCCVLLAAEEAQARVASFDRRVIEVAALRGLMAVES
jgi:predicted nucleic acid-binding protein